MDTPHATYATYAECGDSWFTDPSYWCYCSIKSES